jgi:hypothetical protein
MSFSSARYNFMHRLWVGYQLRLYNAKMDSTQFSLLFGKKKSSFKITEEVAINCRTELHKLQRLNETL